MARAVDGRPPSRVAVLKVLYLVAVTAAAFAVPAVEATRQVQWYGLPGLLGVQVLALLVCGVARTEIFRGVWRLKALFVFLLACYTLLPAGDPAATDRLFDWRPPGTPWVIHFNLTGLAHAGLMCLQLSTVLLASTVVRHTGSGSDLVDGLHAFGLPKLFVHAFDQTLALYGGSHPDRGTKPGRRRDSVPNVGPPPPGLLAILRRLVRGDVGFFLHSLQSSFDRARAQVASRFGDSADARLAHDVAVITGVALAMASLKMVKLLPGVPFAPGIKTVLLFPLYIVASRLTWTRWGATVAGSILGVVSFLQGDGRYGVLDILQHLAPGLVIDLTAPLVSRLPPSAWVFCLLGFVAAVARTSTELAVVLLLGARAEVYLFPAARLIPNLVAGTLSGFVTAFVLRALAQEGPLGTPRVRGTETLAGLASSAPSAPSSQEGVADTPAAQTDSGGGGEACGQAGQRGSHVV
jgi:hypothetical protein